MSTAAQMFIARCAVSGWSFRQHPRWKIGKGFQAEHPSVRRCFVEVYEDLGGWVWRVIVLVRGPEDRGTPEVLMQGIEAAAYSAAVAAWQACKAPSFDRAIKAVALTLESPAEPGTKAPEAAGRS